MMNGVTIVVEKIQKYIYQRIDERRAENQHDNKTLQEIILASNSISKDILCKIKNVFQVDETNSDLVLLWVSGKVIFFSYLSKEDIAKKLKELHGEIYLEYGGNIQLRYAVFSEDIAEDKMKMIQSAKNALSIVKSNNSNLLDIKEELFQFQELKKVEPQQSVTYSDGIFVRDMDALICNTTQKKESTDGKIAVVKADINNMGKIFSEIKDYESYSKLSRLLADKISIEFFKTSIDNNKKSDLKGKILPLYIEGDDVFYAVQIDALLPSIDLLNRMVNEINKEIEKNIKCDIKLGIAVGVVFTNNHQPIRYYHEKVEKELGDAKVAMKIEKYGRVDLGVSLVGNLFYKYRGVLGKFEKDGFSKFYQEIEELKWLKRRKIFSNSFVFKLLNALESDKENPKKQLRHLLYFVLPEVKNTENSLYDLFFKHYLLSQVVEDAKADEGQKIQKRLFDTDKIKSVLIPKLKLILLLIDDRFVQFEDDSNFAFKYIIQKERYSEQLDTIMKVMFTKPLNYLVERPESKIEKVFVGRKSQKIQDQNNQNINITIYKKLPLHVTMLFRMKKLIEQKRCDLAKKLIVNYFEQNRDDLEKTKQEPEQERKIIEYQKKFESKDFECFFKEIEKNQDTDWLDNIILFYKYDEQRAQKKAFKNYLLEFKKNIKFGKGERECIK